MRRSLELATIPLGIDLIPPSIILMVLFNRTFIFCVCGQFNQTGAQYSANVKTGAKAEVRCFDADAPQNLPHSF